MAGLIALIALTFGVCLAQNWPVASEQFIYLLVYAVLLAALRMRSFRWTAQSSEVGIIRRLPVSTISLTNEKLALRRQRRDCGASLPVMQTDQLRLFVKYHGE